MSSPLVTIGCAVYNGEQTLARALQQVTNQTYENLEILIADDCSSDGSRDIYEEFARKDSRIRIIRNSKNLGLAGNCNQLASVAKGDYFTWADQDDVKDTTFVSKTLARLEDDPDAVLCHAHTGVFIGDPADIKYVVTLNGVADVVSPALRYARFLHYFTDMAVYGLIRTEALRRTQLYRKDLAAANALLFQLLLMGKFLQVPEVLYLYSGRGVRNRPDIKAEYARMNPGRAMPMFYFPFLVLARNQTRDLQQAELGALEKVGIGAALWTHTSVVALTKLVYRSLALPLQDHMPDAFTDFCDEIVDPKGHLIFPNESTKPDDSIFPKGWYLKGGD